MGEAKTKAAAAERARRDRKLPENLQLLHDGETNYRTASVSAIEADPVLMDHVILIEAVMEYIHYFSQRPPSDPDHEIIQLLSKRAFNDLASAHGLMLQGYYQTAAALLRDIIETADLVHYFRHKPEEIDVWRKSDHSTRLSQFGPRHIRKFLNGFPGFAEDKRGKKYTMFCEFAAHPTFDGFALMGRNGDQAGLGPFFDPTLLKVIIEELAMLAGQVGLHAGNWFKSEGDIEAMAQRVHFIEVTGN